MSRPLRLPGIALPACCCRRPCTLPAIGTAAVGPGSSGAAVILRGPRARPYPAAADAEVQRSERGRLPGANQPILQASAVLDAMNWLVLVPMLEAAKQDSGRRAYWRGVHHNFES